MLQKIERCEKSRQSAKSKKMEKVGRNKIQRKVTRIRNILIHVESLGTTTNRKIARRIGKIRKMVTRIRKKVITPKIIT